MLWYRMGDACSRIMSWKGSQVQSDVDEVGPVLTRFPLHLLDHALLRTSLHFTSLVVPSFLFGFVDLIERGDGWNSACVWGWVGRAHSDEDEAKVKEETGATLRCFPFEQPTGEKVCLFTSKEAQEVAIFARSYWGGRQHATHLFTQLFSFKSRFSPWICWVWNVQYLPCQAIPTRVHAYVHSRCVCKWLLGFRKKKDCDIILPNKVIKTPASSILLNVNISTNRKTNVSYFCPSMECR